MSLYETEQERERVLLLAVDLETGEDVEGSLHELEELAKTAGAETVGKMIQKRDAIHPGMYIGKGKVEELMQLAMETEADTVICDDELSPAQLGNLEDMLPLKVIDRTVLILDIFAKHATTSEGKIQVELAQLKYRSSRLIGLGKSLSRLGGTKADVGIGNKGPGEKKLELDRRIIKNRMTFLYRELKEIKKNRDVMRKQRMANHIPVVAIVGYTNAGKSTLLNALTEANVLSENKLFATLDPTTREYKAEDGQRMLLTDTVGFIHKLPHHLIEAFRSTLEEAKYADVILHVVDASNPKYPHHMEVVYETLEELGITDKPILTVFNKIDKAPEGMIFKDSKSQRTIQVSAKYKNNLTKMIHEVDEVLTSGFTSVEKTFSYEEAAKVQIIRKFGRLLQEEYRDDGIWVKGTIPSRYESELL